MCLFPTPNGDFKGIAYKKGLKEFDCGACPECLSKRSRLWALRCSMEARKGRACMVTLTYDTFKYDENGNIIGENLADRSVDKKDAQDFLKRLRSYYDDKVKSQIRKEIKKGIKKAFENSPLKDKYKNYRDFRKRYIIAKYADRIGAYEQDEYEKRKVHIKYLLTAEYGKRTHRPHYHALLFGIDFAEDREFYKKSKRGNAIFTSSTLNKVWNKGICTVDCVSVSSKVARYCTKYCAKDARAEDTFMLVSRGIGDEELIKNFNGLYYMVDGREYPIPKLIWNKVIERRMHKNYVYEHNLTSFGTYKYRSLNWLLEKNGDLGYDIDKHLRKCRKWFREFKEKQTDYQKYLAYWSKRSAIYEKVRGNALQRINALSNEKYFSYKQASLHCLQMRKNAILPIAPRANARVRYCHDLYKQYGLSVLEDNKLWLHRDCLHICPAPSRHIRANDRKKQDFPSTKIITRSDGAKVVLHFYPRPNLISPF